MSCYTSHEELIDGNLGYFWRFFGVPAVKLVSVRKHTSVHQTVTPSLRASLQW